MLLLTKEYADEMKCWQTNNSIHFNITVENTQNEYSQQEIKTLDNRRRMEKIFIPQK